VQIWACAFNTSMSSSLFIPSLNGTSGKLLPPTIPTPSSQVLPGVSLAFTQQWKPTSAEVSALQDPANPSADIHCCLMANAFGIEGESQDGAQISGAPNPLATSATWQPWTDPHNAQRNMSLVPKPTPASKMDIFMWAGNPDPEEGHAFELEIFEPLGAELSLADLEMLHAKNFIRCQPRRLAKGAIEGIAVAAGDRLAPIFYAREPVKDLQIEAGECARPRVELELGADEAHPIRLQATLPAEENVLRVFDVVQRQGGVVSGGARILTLSVDGKLLEQHDGGHEHGDGHEHGGHEHGGEGEHGGGGEHGERGRRREAD
jgi:hypothetical protein